jgi:hypothetical protein
MRLNVPCLSSAVVACSSRRRPGLTTLTTHYAGIFPQVSRYRLRYHKLLIHVLHTTQTSGGKASVGEKSAWKVFSLAFGARWPQNTSIDTSAVAAPTTELLDTTTTANNSLTATHTTTNVSTSDITHDGNNVRTTYTAEEVPTY